MDKLNWDDYAPYFHKEEFDCRCGCGLNLMKKHTMDMLLVARGNSTYPFSINSGTRCPNHNKDKGGTKRSSHLSGEAADIFTGANKAKAYVILIALSNAGFRRFGIGKNFIHADDDITKMQGVIWTY